MARCERGIRSTHPDPIRMILEKTATTANYDELRRSVADMMETQTTDQIGTKRRMAATAIDNFVTNVKALFFAFLGLLSLCVFVGIPAYVVLHFIIKYW